MDLRSCICAPVRCVVVRVVNKDIVSADGPKPYLPDTICTMDAMSLNLSSQCVSAPVHENIALTGENTFSPEAALQKRQMCSILTIQASLPKATIPPFFWE